MLNEWFFKWHLIGENRLVEIDAFDGRTIRYSGIKYSGTPQVVYADTIQRYLRQKISDVLSEFENQIQKYPHEIKCRAIDEAHVLINDFAGRIRAAAGEKDRILRGNGFEFPPIRHLGNWAGGNPSDIERAFQSLRYIYCSPKITVEGVEMPLANLMRDKVALVKKDGTVFRKDISANVSSKQITTLVADLPIEVGDFFLRSLPSGLVEEFVVVDPGFHAGLHMIPPHFQTKVRRSDQPAAPAQTVINHIVGDHARVNVNSVDNSNNVFIQNDGDLFSQLAETLTRQIKEASERDSLLALLAELKDAKGKTSFGAKYQKFIAAAASHIEIIAPFIPALTAMLGIAK